MKSMNCSYGIASPTRFSPIRLPVRERTYYDIETLLRSFFGNQVFETVIPRNVRVSEAPSHGLPVLLYDLSCAGSQAYVHLAGELLRRRGREVSKIQSTEDNHWPESDPPETASMPVVEDAGGETE